MFATSVHPIQGQVEIYLNFLFSTPTVPPLRIRIALTNIFTCAETGTPKCLLHL